MIEPILAAIELGVGIDAVVPEEEAELVVGQDERVAHLIPVGDGALRLDEFSNLVAERGERSARFTAPLVGELDLSAVLALGPSHLYRPHRVHLSATLIG